MVYIGQLVVLATLAIFPIFGAGDTCLSPNVDSKIYTTTETQMATDTVIIVEVAVTCKNGLKDMNLYAEMNGKALPASKLLAANQYQVSFSDEHKNLPGGRYTVRFFDEEGYAVLRKAQRTSDATGDIKHLFTVEVDHPGSSAGQWFQSEFIAAAVALLVWYYAYSSRNKMRR